MNSILDFYPCGMYTIEKDGTIQKCVLTNNLSERGAGKNAMKNLYQKGTIEQFQNKTQNKLHKFLLFIVIFIIFIFISFF